ncbi:MAG: hypothetical protein ACP5IK_01565, partial [Candidatus Micrarchaeia archaeon]
KEQEKKPETPPTIIERKEENVVQTKPALADPEKDLAEVFSTTEAVIAIYTMTSPAEVRVIGRSTTKAFSAEPSVLQEVRMLLAERGFVKDRSTVESIEIYRKADNK